MCVLPVTSIIIIIIIHFSRGPGEVIVEKLLGRENELVLQKTHKLLDAFVTSVRAHALLHRCSSLLPST